MKKKKQSIEHASAEALIAAWCNNHPVEVPLNYRSVMQFLFCNRDGTILEDGEPFPSGSDVIDNLTINISGRNRGLACLVKAIQSRDHGVGGDVLTALHYQLVAFLRALDSKKSFVELGNHYLQSLLREIAGIHVKPVGLKARLGGTGSFLCLQARVQRPELLFVSKKHAWKESLGVESEILHRRIATSVITYLVRA